jgi:hypothetical protein
MIVGMLNLLNYLGVHFTTMFQVLVTIWLQTYQHVKAMNNSDISENIRHINISLKLLSRLPAPTSGIPCGVTPSSNRRENLHLSYLMLVNHTVQELQQKVIETYNKFPSQYQGGPLYFKLVMDSLVADLERVSSALLKHMTEYKIHNTKGEDVS